MTIFHALRTMYQWMLLDWSLNVKQQVNSIFDGIVSHLFNIEQSNLLVDTVTGRTPFRIGDVIASIILFLRNFTIPETTFKNSVEKLKSDTFVLCLPTKELCERKVLSNCQCYKFYLQKSVSLPLEKINATYITYISICSQQFPFSGFLTDLIKKYYLTVPGTYSRTNNVSSKITKGKSKCKLNFPQWSQKHWHKM